MITFTTINIRIIMNIGIIQFAEASNITRQGKILYFLSIVVLDNEGVREWGEVTTLRDVVSPLSTMPFFCESSERTRLARSSLKAFQAENGAEDVGYGRFEEL